jgi:hypothetical protein
LTRHDEVHDSPDSRSLQDSTDCGTYAGLFRLVQDTETQYMKDIGRNRLTETTLDAKDPIEGTGPTRLC